jgi:putative hydrolase of the HAD superfamily
MHDEVALTRTARPYDAVLCDIDGVLRHWPPADALVTAWCDLMPRVDREVLSLLARAREVVTVVLVSNATTRLEWDLARQELHDVADIVLNSARIGIAKPDPRVYLIAAERAGTPLQRCLFIDDTAANVIAAREVGMTALHYEQIEDLRNFLVPLWQPSRQRPSPTSRPY